MKASRWLLVLAVIAARPSAAATPPAGFQDTVLFSANLPTGVAYEPGSGNAFLIEKGDGSGGARVRRRALAGGAVTTALTLTCVDANGERGLLGIAFDPDYVQSASTRWVYLYYTRTSPSSGTCAIPGSVGSRNRVVRYKESGGVLSGEELLLEGPVLTVATNHNAGTLRFAPDETLFVSMGDNDTDADANPRSRDLNDLRGKILRIQRTGSAPSDNPFVGQAGTRPEIWAWGFRNPFRFSIDPSTGIPWIGDVGEDRWEEIDRGVKGADYGYPCFEGNVSFRNCNPAAANPTPPAFVYGHYFTQPDPFFGTSVTGGPVYRNGNFPASYTGRVFFGDYADDWIRSGRIDPGGTLSDVQLFMADANNVVDIVQAPNGCLAWVDIYAGSLHETCYTAGSNRGPTVVATAVPTSGSAPLVVQFTGSNSTDADGDPLTYAWDFGDGGHSSAADPSHSYAAGSYSATLTINDQRGLGNSQSVSQPIQIISGNHAPVASISQPTAGTHYDAGDTIAFSGGATDEEDGTIPASGLSWTIVFHHDTHTHPFEGPIDGVSSGSFTIPTSGEDSTNVWFRIHLTATDSGGSGGPGLQASSSATVDILPNTATITLDAKPSGQGLKVSFSGTQVVAPASFDSVVNFPRAIAAPSPQRLGSRTWTFLHWNDSVAGARTIATPQANTTYTATFRCTSGCSGLVDRDGDGFASVADGGTDCDDGDSTIFPGAPELCDGKDNDCAAGVDDATCSAFVGGDGRMNGVDLAQIGRFFGVCSATAGSEPWANADLTKDGCLDGNDLALMAAVWGCSGTVPVCH
jgi:glucose/arabinose dehydrogenase/PKD repeat protein